MKYTAKRCMSKEGIANILEKFLPLFHRFVKPIRVYSPERDIAEMVRFSDATCYSSQVQ